jgi:peptidoglycan-associated lipoprotein
MRLSKSVPFLSLVALATATACSHAQPAAEEKQAAQPQAAAPAPQAAPTPQAPQNDATADGQAELDRAMQQLRDVSVFFEFDSATLTQEARDRLSAVGTILAKHADLKVRVEGNCDERGSEQYNLALGQRRAESAKRYLVGLGARESQLMAISFGAEKPRAQGHDEEAWRQNRRDDLNAVPASYRR